MQQKSIEQEAEFIQFSKNKQIKYLDKDRNSELHTQKTIDSKDFSFEDYYNNSVDLQLIAKHEEPTLQTAIVRKKSKESAPQDFVQQNEDMIIMKGFLDRQILNILQSWEKRYCVLTLKQIFCFEEQNRQNLISCINLKMLQCSISQEYEVLKIYYCVKNQPIVLRAKTIQQCVNWANNIKYVINLQTHVPKVYIKSQVATFYSQRCLLTQSQFKNQVETCDIVLMKTKGDSKCAIQRFVTHSQYDHVGIMIKFQNKEVNVFESNPNEGVAMYNWEDYQNRFTFYQQICYRKLIYQKKKELQNILIEFVKATVGKQYDIGAIKLLKQWSSQDKSKRSYFCSELVAKSYKKLGLIQKQKASARYWPIDFTERGGLVLLDGAALGRQKLIILDRHTNKYQ